MNENTTHTPDALGFKGYAQYCGILTSAWIIIMFLLTLLTIFVGARIPGSTILQPMLSAMLTSYAFGYKEQRPPTKREKHVIALFATALGTLLTAGYFVYFTLSGMPDAPEGRSSLIFIGATAMSALIYYFVSRYFLGQFAKTTIKADEEA